MIQLRCRAAKAFAQCSQAGEWYSQGLNTDSASVIYALNHVYMFENQSITTMRVILWALMVEAGPRRDGNPDNAEIIL